MSITYNAGWTLVAHLNAFGLKRRVGKNVRQKTRVMMGNFQQKIDKHTGWLFAGEESSLSKHVQPNVIDVA